MYALMGCSGQFQKLTAAPSRPEAGAEPAAAQAEAAQRQPAQPVHAAASAHGTQAAAAAQTARPTGGAATACAAAAADAPQRAAAARQEVCATAAIVGQVAIVPPIRCLQAQKEMSDEMPCITAKVLLQPKDQGHVTFQTHCM